MTEREKIIEVIAPYVSAWGDDEAIADALIAAGIGDVKKRNELKVELRSKIDYIHEQDEVIAHYKHRAEVAEKMFDTLYEEISEYMRVLSKEWYKRQAEMELAEERKDD